MDIQNRLTGFANMGAAWVMWLLIGLSVVALAIALERALYLASTRDDLRRLRRDVLDALGRGGPPAPRARLARSRSVEAEVVAAGLTDDSGSASTEERMAGAAQLAPPRLGEGAPLPGTPRAEAALL